MTDCKCKQQMAEWLERERMVPKTFRNEHGSIATFSIGRIRNALASITCNCQPANEMLASLEKWANGDGELLIQPSDGSGLVSCDLNEFEAEQASVSHEERVREFCDPTCDCCGMCKPGGEYCCGWDGDDCCRRCMCKVGRRGARPVPFGGLSSDLDGQPREQEERERPDAS